MKMCEHILKKRQRPNTIQILWIVKKNQEHRNIAPLSLQLRSYNKPTKVGRIALERHAGGKTLDHTEIQTMDLPIPHQKHCPLGYQSLFELECF